MSMERRGESLDVRPRRWYAADGERIAYVTDSAVNGIGLRYSPSFVCFRASIVSMSFSRRILNFW